MRGMMMMKRKKKRNRNRGRKMMGPMGTRNEGQNAMSREARSPDIRGSVSTSGSTGLVA